MSKPTIKEPERDKAQSLHIFQGDGFELAYAQLGATHGPVIIWGHGWGQNHTGFLPLAQSLAPLGRHIVLDFPGFGESPVPFDKAEDSWGSGRYADAMAEFIGAEFAGERVIWIGHSFGCRVGTQLGARYGGLVQRMVFVAGAGLKRKRGLVQRVVLRCKVLAFKAGKRFKDWPFIKRFASQGSADYRNAGPMRGTLVQVVNEDLAAEAAAITCPVLLIYGSNDTETPPETGERYKALIKNSEMVHLSGQDHYSVLSDGRHAVAGLIKNFILADIKNHD